jgi:hypothetical protein
MVKVKHCHITIPAFENRRNTATKTIRRREFDNIPWGDILGRGIAMTSEQRLADALNKVRVAGTKAIVGSEFVAPFITFLERQQKTLE